MAFYIIFVLKQRVFGSSLLIIIQANIIYINIIVLIFFMDYNYLKVFFKLKLEDYFQLKSGINESGINESVQKLKNRFYV